MFGLNKNARALASTHSRGYIGTQSTLVWFFHSVIFLQTSKEAFFFAYQEKNTPDFFCKCRPVGAKEEELSFPFSENANWSVKWQFTTLMMVRWSDLSVRSNTQTDFSCTDMKMMNVVKYSNVYRFTFKIKIFFGHPSELETSQRVINAQNHNSNQ